MSKQFKSKAVLFGVIAGFVSLSFIFASPPAHSQSRSQASRSSAKAPVVPKIYCWDTPTGRQCGDTVPPEAAGASRDEFSPRTGTRINHVERAKTPEEIAQEKWEMEVKQRRRAEQERIEREVSNVRMRYDSVDAIRQDFADRRTGLEVGLELAQESARSAHLAFISSLDTLAGLEMEGKAVTEKAYQRVVEKHAEWKERRVGVDTSQARIAELDRQMELSIQMWLGVSDHIDSASQPAVAQSVQGVESGD